MSARQRLCALAELADPGSRACTVHAGDRTLELMLIRKSGRVFAYRNDCPHTGGPLDWAPGVFLDLSRRYVQCATHDALFRIEDGECVHGPCVGERLRPEPVLCERGHVWWLNTDCATPDET